MTLQRSRNQSGHIRDCLSGQARQRGKTCRGLRAGTARVVASLVAWLATVRRSNPYVSRLPVIVAGVFLIGIGASPVSAEIIDRILATVAGQIITKSDVEAARALGLIQPAAAESQSPDDAALQALIDRVLMLNEVRRVVPREPAEAAITARIAEIRNRFPSQAALQQTLAASGIDEAVLRVYAEGDLSLASYLDERFSAAAQPTEQELLQAGEDNRGKLAAERRRTLVNAWIAELRRRADISILQ